MDPQTDSYSDPQRADSDPQTDSFRALNQQFQLTRDHIEEFRRLCLAEGSVQEVLDFLSVIAAHNPLASIADNEWNTFLHIACEGGKVEVVEQLIEGHSCKPNGANIYGETPLHFACAGGHSSVVDKLVSRYGADLMVKDKKGNEPLHTAALNGHTRLIIATLISKYRCDPTSIGQNGQNLLHLSLINGHKELAETLLKSFSNILSTGSIDNDGNTPLHLASLNGQEECVEMLLHRYNAPIFIRNKAERTARDLSKGTECWLIFKQYLENPQTKTLQSTNEELHLLSLRNYSSQLITRVFVVGNSKSGKSTLIEAFKRKGLVNSRIPVNVVAPNTPGIVPSHYDSKKIGRIIYYDFAGDSEYYSSHSAIIEVVFQSQGNDFFFIVLNLCKDINELKKQLGYWLSFISYLHKQNTAQCQSKIRAFLICSHADMLDIEVAQEKMEYLKEVSTEFKQSNNLIEIKHIAQMNCRLPQEVRALKEFIQMDAKDVPCCLSYEATLLHGVLEKNFSNLIACKLKDVMDRTIDNAQIQLPSKASKIYTIARELQNAGLLLIIGRSEDQFEDYLLLMDIKSLTSEVHKKLFSKIARDNLKSLPTRMGILPENCLYDILKLPEHITKECLVQLQYCHEFSRVEVKCDDNTVVPSMSSSDNLLYFPDLCKLETASAGILNPDPGQNSHLNIGWYAKCVGNFDYFPPRFLHTLLLRLAYSFALHIPADKEESQLYSSIRQDNRRCTMWKNGICWRMEEGVVCFCEVVDGYKGIVVITQASKSNDKITTVLRQIIHKVLLTKAQYCDIISLQHFVLNSADPYAYQNKDELYDINDIENVIRLKNKGNVVSVGGNKFLDSSHHSILRILSHQCTYWGIMFPITVNEILTSIKDIVNGWEELGLNLELEFSQLRSIDTDKTDIQSKKEAMIAEWMGSQPACWWLLVKALECMNEMNAAGKIRRTQGAVIEVQKGLIETDLAHGHCKPDDDFLESFADVVGGHWCSLATVLSVNPSDVEEICSEREKALQVLKKWQLNPEATYGQLKQKLQTISIFQC